MLTVIASACTTYIAAGTIIPLVNRVTFESNKVITPYGLGRIRTVKSDTDGIIYQYLNTADEGYIQPDIRGNMIYTSQPNNNSSSMKWGHTLGIKDMNLAMNTGLLAVEMKEHIYGEPENSIHINKIQNIDPSEGDKLNYVQVKQGNDIHLLEINGKTVFAVVGMYRDALAKCIEAKYAFLHMYQAILIVIMILAYWMYKDIEAQKKYRKNY